MNVDRGNVSLTPDQCAAIARLVSDRLRRAFDVSGRVLASSLLEDVRGIAPCVTPCDLWFMIGRIYQICGIRNNDVIDISVAAILEEVARALEGEIAEAA